MLRNSLRVRLLVGFTCIFAADLALMITVAMVSPHVG
jgi:hypothetical protein